MSDLSDVTGAFLECVHDTCLRFNYSEFDGMKSPSLVELYTLRGLIDGVIEETRIAEQCSP